MLYGQTTFLFQFPLRTTLWYLTSRSLRLYRCISIAQEPGGAVLHDEKQRSKAQVKTFRKYGGDPFRVVVVHGGPGAAGSVAPMARKLGQTRGVLEPLQTATTLDGQVEEL